jgi:hypothetical protein
MLCLLRALTRRRCQAGVSTVAAEAGPLRAGVGVESVVEAEVIVVAGVVAIVAAGVAAVAVAVVVVIAVEAVLTKEDEAVVLGLIGGEAPPLVFATDHC